MIKIPKTMSTQHPDNVHSPFFASGSVIGGEDEIKEAFFAFSHLGCEEQLWDCEGKETDSYVVKKLLTKYDSFFAKKKLGKDLILTLRVPNPSIEKNEAKILLETLESIPRSFDVARLFYGEDISPIFEIFLPMTSNAMELRRIREYYSKIVVGKKEMKIIDNDIKISEWIGDFKPDEIRVTPLIEEKDTILNADKIVEEYITNSNVKDYQRVWLARSDPALNFGSLAAILMNKIALHKLDMLEEKSSIELFPILGCGSAPFRGNLSPLNLNCLDGYPSVHTFTVQSAFKYDYENFLVTKAIEKINSRNKKRAPITNEEVLKKIIEKTSESYRKQIESIALLINTFSKHIPQRRKRKLHVGLYGYSRPLKGSISLPRAIGFCATLYSLGIPPELIGLDVLTRKDISDMEECYKNFEYDMKSSLKYMNKDNLHIFPLTFQKHIEYVLENLEFNEDMVDSKHKKITSIIAKDYSDKNFISLEENIVRAGSIRGFLG
ncbi:MAG: phosphoenolpyruvate carboxylase [Candidatus Aenigmarchaeota archaeon]|nr:phosphoenolpyruvate carboxylase [Candidatus Aenigmarchaeota archaeon]